jgi:hypothetical protein
MNDMKHVTETGAGVLVDLLVQRWGVSTSVRIPWRWDQRRNRSTAAASRYRPVRAGETRGGSSIRCVQLCEVHWPPWRLLTDARSGRYLLAERAVRRNGRPNAHACHYRPAIIRCDRNAHPAGFRYCPTDRRSSALFRHGHATGRQREYARSCGTVCAGQSGRLAHWHSNRRLRGSREFRSVDLRESTTITPPATGQCRALCRTSKTSTEPLAC